MSGVFFEDPPTPGRGNLLGLRVPNDRCLANLVPSQSPGR